MVNVLRNYINTLPKETLTKREFRAFINDKYPETLQDVLVTSLLNKIYKITDTLFYLEYDIGSSAIRQRFFETAYQDMAITFSLHFYIDTLQTSTLAIYKVIEDEIYNVSFSNLYQFGETNLTFGVVGNDALINIYNVSPDEPLGQYLQLGEYDPSNPSAFIRRLISHSPIILPAPLEDFPGKINEAFTYFSPPGEDVTGIQFIDLLGDIETI